MAQRESGYYWVQPKLGDEWEIVNYDAEHNLWWIVGCELPHYTDEFDVINAQKIVR